MITFKEFLIQLFETNKYMDYPIGDIPFEDINAYALKTFRNKIVLGKKVKPLGEVYITFRVGIRISDSEADMMIQHLRDKFGF